MRRFLKLLDPTYGLYLHWKWERMGKGSLFDHLLCGLHYASITCLVIFSLYYLVEILLVSRMFALIVSLAYAIAIPLVASIRARKVR